MLDARCTLMHAGWLSGDDIAAFRRAGVTVDHNPVVNAMLGFGTRFQPSRSMPEPQT